MKEMKEIRVLDEVAEGDLEDKGEPGGKRLDVRRHTNIGEQRIAASWK